MYHTIDICQHIAEKLRSSNSLYQIIEEDTLSGIFSSKEWAESSLTYGMPGIACFFVAMAHLFPDQRWDDAAHEYLKIAVSRCESNWFKNSSLFEGTCGLCFATYLCSSNGTRYQKLLGKLEGVLAQEVMAALNQNKSHAAVDQNSFPYRVGHGLGGIAAYLMLRKQEQTFKHLLRDSIKAMIDYFKLQNLHTLPLSISEGITGGLSILSLAAWEDISVPGLLDTIKALSNCLREKQTVLISELTPSASLGYQSTPSIALSLFLAGRVLGDKPLKAFAEESYVALLSKPDEGNLSCPSFGWGKAGLLAVTYRMARLTNNEFLLRKVRALEQELRHLYNPSHPLGFQRTYVTESGERQQINDPGLFGGAAGIALALLSADDRIENVMWDRAFLLR